MSTKDNLNAETETPVDKDDIFIIDDDCDEDVPGDFFDDFLKEDFMAGLDIVDDDQWENGELKKGDKSVSNQQNKETSNDVKEAIEKDKGQKKKKTNKRDKPSKEKKGIDADEFDIRRDPNKTKRDIERNKAKCERDKEKKMITEKLKLVETGLLPPGTEMEADISEIEKNKEGKKETTSSTKNGSPSKRKRSPVRSVSSKRRVPSPQRSRNRSPFRTGRSPRRSPIRRRSRERFSRERKSRERSIERTLRSLRRSRSPYRDRRSRYSPDYSRQRRRRSRSRSRGKKRDEKKSFLQEIVEKLRETRPQADMVHNQYITHMQPGHPHMQPNSHYMQTAPHMETVHPHMQPNNSMISAPVQPVPAPTFPIVPSQSIPSQAQVSSQNQYDPYDQSFFIGTPQPSGFVPSQGQQPAAMSPMVNQASGLSDYQTEGNKKNDLPPQEVEKLFHDKKITLSEFLAVTAKPEVYSGTPVQLKDKVKVLSRCHDAIKILETGEKKFQGRLHIRKTVRPLVTEDKNRSPLLKMSEVKIPFTEIPNKEKNKSAFSIYLNNLLQDIGLLNEVVDVDNDAEPIISSFVPKGTSPPPPPHISRQKQGQRFPEQSGRIYSEYHLSKMVQTDAVPKCTDCEKRKKVIYKTTGCQTGELMTYSVSTQVTEDEFVSKIPKNQSLASLTPAQLLAQNASSASSKRYSDADEFDIYPSKNPYSRGGFDYARTTESFNNSGSMLNTRYMPSDRDRDESMHPNNSQYQGARGRGPPNSNFDTGSRYGYY